MSTSANQILDNAISAIELGIEDYNLASEDAKRIQSSVRNIFAGILLLFKSKLAEISKNDDEALIKERILPKIENGKLLWVGTGTKTVDTRQIQERFESLGINVDWKKLKELQDYRNTIEHYYDKSGITIQTVREYIASSFSVIYKFIKQELDLDPHSLFSDETWSLFLEEKEFYDEELKEKTNSFNSVSWYSDEVKTLFKDYKCSNCNSELIRAIKATDSLDAVSASFECRNCNEKRNYEDLAIEISEHLSENSTYSPYDEDYFTGETIAFCPECENNTFFTDGNICLLCGCEGPFICDRCGEVVPPSEYPVYNENGLCGWCAHMEDHIFEDDDD